VSTAFQIFSAISEEVLLDFTAKAALEKLSSTKLPNIREAIVNKLIEILLAYRTSTFPNAAVSIQSQLNIPTSIPNFVLYILALIKNPALRGGSDIKFDERVYWINALRTIPLEEAAIFIHPRLYSLSPSGLTAEIGVVNDDGTVTLPSQSALSCDSLDAFNIMLLDTALGLWMWIGRSTPQEILLELFGVSSQTELDFSMASIPEIDNPFNQKVRNIINFLQHCHSWPQSLRIFREIDDVERRTFSMRMVCDRGGQNMLSYSEFFAYLQKHVNSK